MSFLKISSAGRLKMSSDSKLIVKPFIVQTYSLFADKNTINEGETVTFTLTTTSVEQGTIIPFNVFGLGITQDDFVEGNLSDNFIINNNTANYTFKAKNDATTEGDETMIVALTNFPSVSTSVLILDTSKAPPAYNVTAPASVSEGTTITFTISTIGVPNGSVIPYTISGSVSSLDFDIGGTGNIDSGNVTIIADNQLVPLGFATVTFNVKNDVLTEGTENITLTIPVSTLPIQLQPDPLVNVSATVSIIDTSVNGFVSPINTTIYDSSGNIFNTAGNPLNGNVPDSWKQNQYIAGYVDIGTSATSIGSNAFQNNLLTSVTISNSVTSIGSAAFETNQLQSVTIGNSVTNIGSSAFRYNQLQSVTIPNSVTNIGSGAFRYNQLTSVTISNSVTSIGSAAFETNQLQSVTIPNSVTSIGSSAFRNNPSLATVICYTTRTSFSSGTIFQTTASPLTIRVRASDTTWTAGTGLTFQGNNNVTVIKNL